ncbi:MAG: hypothetical protein PHU34_02665 [Candidatus Methanoperedens sp.]|nr:hypothetical protein [Candidatus Methanoperedens sp.]
MNNKILLLAIAVISVGLFAMPSTLSLFAGQHTFYNGSQVNCNKCHQDIYNEMTSAGVSTAHRTTALQACQGCHLTGNISQVPFNATSNMSWYNNSIAGNPNAHAAITLECVACHQGVPAEFNNTAEAHVPFYLNSSYTINTSAGLNAVNQTVIQLNGANTACVGCHTHIAMNVTWIRTKGYSIVANETTGSYSITYSTNTTANNLQINYSAGS